MMVEFHLPYPPSVNHYWRRVRSDSPALHREGAAGKPVVRIQKASESMLTLRPYQEKVKTVVFGCLQTHDDNRCTVAPAAGGNGQVPANECPDCQVVIAAGFARRPQCGYAFPPPERTPHEGKATEAEILSQRITDTHYDVRDLVYRVHKKRGAGEQSSKSLRVDYLN